MLAKDDKRRKYQINTLQSQTMLNGYKDRAVCEDGPGGQQDLNDNARKEKSLWLRWRTILYDFTQSTTLHGLVNVTSPQPFWIRRLFWLLLFLGGCVLFAIQVITSVMYFLSWPVAVDVKINYNDTIVFPAVTICNQNAFRTTEAYKRQQYYLLNHLFSGNEIQSFNTTDITLEDLYLGNAHNLSDLVVSCTWDGQECDNNSFIPTLTDFGLCYTFNSGRAGKALYKATQTGSEGGLRLQLNIEQYEYMRGPNPGAGLKLQIHNQEDVPLVKDHGLAVPPGSHGFVAIKTVEVNNLKHPHGKCNDSVELDYFPTYTMSSCYMDCKERFLIDKCGCRDVYMAEDPFKNSPICSVTGYRGCMLDALDKFMNMKESCDCPIPCHRRMYDPTMSYASTSNFDIDALLRHESTSILQDKYVNARETQQRVNEGVIMDDTSLILALNESVLILTDAFSRLSTSLVSASDTLVELYSEMEQRIHFHLDRGLNEVKYNVEHDFIRGWDVFEERAFYYVCADFFDVATSVRRTFRNYSADVPDDVTNRRLIHTPVRNMLDGRLETMVRTEDYLNKTSHAYNTGDPLLTYEQTIDRRYDMSYISLDIIHAGLKDEGYYYNQLTEGFGWFKQGIALLHQVGQQFLETGRFNETLYLEGEDRFYRSCRRINYRLFMYEERVVEKPLEVTEDRIEDFERLNRTFHSTYTTVLRKMNEVRALLTETDRNLIRDILAVSYNASEYLLDLTKEKSPLCKATAKMDDTVRQLTVAFGELRSEIRSLDESLYELKEACIAVWSSMLGEVSTKTFYKHIHNDSMIFLEDEDEYDKFIRIFAFMARMKEDELRNHTRSEIIKIINADFHVINLEQKITYLRFLFHYLAQDIDVTSTIGDRDEKLLSSFENLRASFEKFLAANDIDSNFYRENFMRLDVFMQELSYEEITQQKAYDVARLLSDIGGSMGLFIGGSVLSIFEIFDLFIHHGARMAMNR